MSKKTFGAYLIDPVAKEITVVRFDGTHQNAGKLVGAPWIEALGAADGANLIFDEEALVHEPRKQPFWWTDEKLGTQEIFGRCLVVEEIDGDWVSARMQPLEVLTRVRWHKP